MISVIGDQDFSIGQPVTNVIPPSSEIPFSLDGHSG